MDDAELLDLLERLEDQTNPLNDVELGQVQAAIVEIVQGVDRSNPSDDDIAVLVESVEQLEKIQAVQAQRAAVVAERAAKADELISKIIPAEPVEPETEEAEAIAAAAAPRLPSISRLAARRPAERRPIVAATEGAWRGGREVLTAAGEPATKSIVETVRWALEREYADGRYSAPMATNGRKRFLSIRTEWPEDRSLNMNEEENGRKIDAVCGTQALVASGGICGPVNVDYTVSGISVADRPVLDALPNFEASRGGARFILPHSLASVTADGPITVWTEANDISLNSPSTKGKATLACGSVVEVFVTAVVEQIRLGRFQMRYSPETVQNYLETADAAWARTADATLLQTMVTGSTSVNSGSYLLGTASELMAELDRAAAAYRYRHRTGPSAMLTLLYPAWLNDQLRADAVLGNSLEISGGRSERLAVTDAEIAQWFQARHLDARMVWDSPTGTSPLQGFGTQAAGDLLAWPLKAQCLLFAPGAWLALQGGTLDLGVIVDASLAATNDAILFKEVFETVAFRGVESLSILFEVLPTGARAGTVSTSTLTTSGS